MNADVSVGCVWESLCEHEVGRLGSLVVGQNVSNEKLVVAYLIKIMPAG